MKTPQLPIPELSNKLGTKTEIWFKFENKHHLGSHKGRSIPLMMSENIKNDLRSFVISSSGNAALAALRFTVSHNKNKPSHPITLTIFIGPSIAQNKYEKLLQEKGNSKSIAIIRSENPKQSALQFSKENNAVWLRGSSDPLALTGYENLAEELGKINGLAAVFFAASSGTSAEGCFLGFKKIGKIPEIHIVQTPACHPLVNAWLAKTGKNEIPRSEDKSRADAIVDIVGKRSDSLSGAIIESGGCGWICDNAEIDETLNILNSVGQMDITANGALPVAGLFKAIKNGPGFSGPVACIIGGD